MSDNTYLMASSPVAVHTEAPSWKQFQTDQSFKLHTLEGKEADEPFKNAFEALKAMNPNVYQLPHGVNSTSPSNIIISLILHSLASLQSSVPTLPTS